MWRAFFLAAGIYCCILGAECLAIDKAIIVSKADDRVGNAEAKHREIVPPAWAPWSLISAGAVVVLYSFTIPRRAKD